MIFREWGRATRGHLPGQLRESFSHRNPVLSAGYRVLLQDSPRSRHSDSRVPLRRGEVGQNNRIVNRYMEHKVSVHFQALGRSPNANPFTREHEAILPSACSVAILPFGCCTAGARHRSGAAALCRHLCQPCEGIRLHRSRSRPPLGAGWAKRER